MSDMLDRLFLIDTGLGRTVVKTMRRYANQTTVQDVIDLSNIEETLYKLGQIHMAGLRFKSIGIVAHGSDSFEWSSTLMHKPIADILKELLIRVGNEKTYDGIDLFACDMDRSDCCLNVLSRNLGDVPVYYSINMTGTLTSIDDWAMEESFMKGEHRPFDQSAAERNVQVIYLLEQINGESVRLDAPSMSKQWTFNISEGPLDARTQWTAMPTIISERWPLDP